MRTFDFMYITFDSFILSLQGWFGYAMWANTYKLRKNLMNYVDEKFGDRISDMDIDRWFKLFS